jgi:glycosyltransferase involved in cell wall biosynthesis
MTKESGVLFVANDLRPGGAEMFLLRLARFLSADVAVYIHCLYPERNDTEFVMHFEEQLSFHFLLKPELGKSRENLYWKINALCNLFGFKGVFTKLKKSFEHRGFARQLKKHGIRAIFSSGISSDYRSTLFLKNECGIPVILTMHSDYNEEFWDLPERNRKDFFKLAQEIFKNTDALFYTADHNTKVFEHLHLPPTLPIKKCYLGFEKKPYRNIRTELKIPFDAFVCVMMARGIAQKGWEEGLEAFETLIETNPNSYLLLIHTPSDYMAHLKNKYAHLSNVRFCGFISEPSGILYSSDLMLFPSYFPESLPYAITEALACSLPVLSTPIAEIPQMLEASGAIAGELIPLDAEGKCDAIVLGEKMKHYANDPNLLEHKRSLASKAFEKFDMQTCGNMFRESLLPYL